VIGKLIPAKDRRKLPRNKARQVIIHPPRLAFGLRHRSLGRAGASAHGYLKPQHLPFPYSDEASALVIPSAVRREGSASGGIYVEGKHIGKATSAQEATPRLLARRQADEDTIVVRNGHPRAPIDKHARMTEHNSRFTHVKPVREFSMREDVVNTLAW